MELREVKIFHVDRRNLLTENSTVTLGQNGLSYFGDVYHRIFGVPFEQLNDAEKRELLAESVRRRFFPYLPSRFTCIFAALTLNDAIQYGNEIIPRPETFRVYEVFSPCFHVRDLNYLDAIPPTLQEREGYMRAYWEEKLYQGTFLTNPSKPIRLEVVIPLGIHPLKVGAMVQEIRN